jgi:hypothetical protein
MNPILQEHQRINHVLVVPDENRTRLQGDMVLRQKTLLRKTSSISRKRRPIIPTADTVLKILNRPARQQIRELNFRDRHPGFERRNRGSNFSTQRFGCLGVVRKAETTKVVPPMIDIAAAGQKTRWTFLHHCRGLSTASQPVPQNRTTNQ